MIVCSTPTGFKCYLLRSYLVSACVQNPNQSHKTNIKLFKLKEAVRFVFLKSNNSWEKNPRVVLFFCKIKTSCDYVAVSDFLKFDVKYRGGLHYCT